jgi:sec-independent protein translocase protein TatA
MIGDILQPTHLLFVLVVALLVLGPKRLPEAGRALGKGIRDFRSAIGGEDDHSDALPGHAAPPPEAVVPPAAAPPVETAPPAGDTTTEHTETQSAEADRPAETVHPVG